MLQKNSKLSIHSIISEIGDNQAPINVVGLAGSEKALLVSRLTRQLTVPILIISPDVKAAERFISDVSFYSGKSALEPVFFPPYNILPFKRLAYHNETAADRIKVLYQLAVGNSPPLLVTTIDAIMQKLIPKTDLCEFAELVMVNEDVDRDHLISQLIAGGYVRSTMVEEPGDFSIRGGIIDLFSPLYPNPVRIEFFGDTVDSLRFFSAANQRKLQSISEVVILPAKEAILQKENYDQIINRIRLQAAEINLPVTKVRELVDRLKTEGVFPGIESLNSLVFPQLDTLFDYILDKSLCIVTHPEEQESSALKFEARTIENYEQACSEQNFCISPEKLYLKWDQTKAILEKRRLFNFPMLPVSKPGEDQKSFFSQLALTVYDNANVQMALKNFQNKDRILMPLVEWIEDKKQNGYAVIIVCSTGTQAERIRSLLAPYGIELELSDDFITSKKRSAAVQVCLGQISSGFVWPAEALAIISEDEIFGSKQHRKHRYKKQVHTEILQFEDLKKGDLVVHMDHGIGQYQGLKKLKMDGISNDFILISYKDGDKLYLPVDRMNMARKYIGIDGIKPVLDKMGGKSWDRIKAKTKQSVEKIAGELLKLYAARKVKTGHAFSRADSYFHDFEAGFPYEETPDQLKAINDVLNNMEKSTPMDRLICGDVGYGKTEVALRASFKAINDGKQVAILVPTTILAEQHLKTFSERFKRYPVNLACLNRFRTTKEQHKIVAELKSGALDLVIGTHRLLQKDVGFKSLGLIVIDEEQRFGVKHKEKLKNLRETVDVLALTATPIPRTLHMSLMGIRDISVISTPPEDRRSIITYISEMDDTVVVEAVQKELARKGQVFFIHNNIQTISNMAGHIRELVPQAGVGIAHGRLSEHELEKIMLQFINNEIDVLVCTTIVESGLDIPAANTIIVNRADRFGLAQIYQLRGRVGRADEQAYAYLFIPKESALGKDAQKRLKVLMEHSGLGSGFQIAMSDLQIRGGGAALGASQSGHIAAVGYDMFLELMENAVSELKGEPVIEKLEPEINMSMSARIPESYIPDIDQRLSAYRRLAKMTDNKEIGAFKSELVDRYGPLPTETKNLIFKMMLKILAAQAGIKRLDLTPRTLLLDFSEAHQKNPFGIIDMATAEPEKYQFMANSVLKVSLPRMSLNTGLAFTKNVLKEIVQRVSG